MLRHSVSVAVAYPAKATAITGAIVGTIIGTMLVPSPLMAQSPAVPPSMIILKPNIHVIDEDVSHGGAITILSGQEGTLIVDAGITALAASAARHVPGLDPRPVRFIVNTHGHVDEVGGNAYFADRGATIIATARTRARMLGMIADNPASMASATPAPGPARETRQRRPPAVTALPLITIEQDLDLHINGEDVRVIPLPPAHTDGDALVVFSSANIIAAGDVLRVREFPSINRASGGTLAGMLEALDTLIGLSDADTLIVTSRGTIGRRGDALIQRQQLATARDRITALIADGHNLEQILASDITSDFGIADRPGRLSHDAFVRDVYEGLVHPD